MTRRYIIVCNLLDELRTGVVEHNVEMLNGMHRLQRLPIFKPDYLINLLACDDLLHATQSREESWNKRKKKKGFHIIAGDSGTKRSINIIIDFLSCTRGKIIGNWVYC